MDTPSASTALVRVISSGGGGGGALAEECSNSDVISERDDITEEGVGASEATAAEGTVPISCLKQPFFSKSASSRQYSIDGKQLIIYNITLL